MLERYFIAINVQDSAKEKLTILLKKLREKGVRTVPPKDLHFTLKFLGNVKPDKVQKTIESLSKIEFVPFRIKLKGVGAFPSESYIRVVWAGAESKELEEFSGKINSSLEKLFSREKFSAHLTLGRVNGKINLSSFFKENKDRSLGSFSAESFKLIQSELTKKGPVYSAIWSSSE